MRKKDAPLFGSRVEPSCEYCDNNLCPQGEPRCRFGLKLEDGCKRYHYNPILRRPKAQPPLPEFDPEDFTI